MLAGVGAVTAVRRRNWFPIALLGTAGATAIPALIQGQQRDIHYLAMPLLLLFSAVGAGSQPLLLGQTKQATRLRSAFVLVAAVALFSVFRQGSAVRTYFVQTPYGASLATFRSEVAALTPEGGRICATLDLDPRDQTQLIAEMSGESSFLVPPINASQIYLIPIGQTCPAQGLTSHIVVKVNQRGDFVATA